MSYKLITNAGDYRAFKIFIAAKYAGVNVDYDEKEFEVRYIIQPRSTFQTDRIFIYLSTHIYNTFSYLKMYALSLSQL